MHLHAVDRGLELIERIQLPLLYSPVVLVAPVVDEVLQIREVCTVIPMYVRGLIGEPSMCKSALEVFQDGVGNVNRERHDAGGIRDRSVRGSVTSSATDCLCIRRLGCRDDRHGDAHQRKWSQY